MSPRRKIIPYRKELVSIAKKLRKNSTPGEIELWKGLKKKQILGYDFDRQKPIHKYIVDFYCKDLRLAIEIDGRSHDFKIGYDQVRQQELENLGVSFLRFSESDAKHYTQSVLTEIERWILKNYGRPTP
ncbi:endonuclease domain-containing protein [Gracilimonas amylolytica]|uniref:endonuclease domain-containing protein n=1 Tax=Gracilimonas amylolytica TaxID=1749045 RepID=UPI000CD84824|nr:endonuclease domain-containing protein [Gracilimonas amylolytica]